VSWLLVHRLLLLVTDVTRCNHWLVPRVCHLLGMPTSEATVTTTCVQCLQPRPNTHHQSSCGVHPLDSWEQ
jgi:hypothetical protein